MNIKYLSSIEIFQIIWNVWDGPENLPKFSIFPDFHLINYNRIYENKVTSMAMEYCYRELNLQQNDVSYVYRWARVRK